MEKNFLDSLNDWGSILTDTYESSSSENYLIHINATECDNQNIADKPIDIKIKGTVNDIDLQCQYRPISEEEVESSVVVLFKGVEVYINDEMVSDAFNNYFNGVYIKFMPYMKNHNLSVSFYFIGGDSINNTNIIYKPTRNFPVHASLSKQLIDSIIKNFEDDPYYDIPYPSHEYNYTDSYEKALDKIKLILKYIQQKN